MGSFDRAKKAVEEIQSRGCESNSSVKQTLEAYEQQASLADRALRDKQAKERQNKS